MGGLANRIRVMESGLALSKKINAQLIVVWESNKDLNARFVDLFETTSSFTVIDLAPGLNFISWRPLYYPDKKPQGWRACLFALTQQIQGISTTVWYDDLHQIFKELHPLYQPDSGLNQEGIAQQAQTKIDAILTPILASKTSFYISSSWNISIKDKVHIQLKPTTRLKLKIDSVEIDKENTVGIHIRRTDHEWAKAHSGIEKFEAEMLKEIQLNDKAKFFVASDSPEVLTALKTSFGKRILHFDHKTMSREQSAGIDSAMIDLYCLARCKKIYGSYLSTFSDLAGQIGGITVLETK